MKHPSRAHVERLLFVLDAENAEQELCRLWDTKFDGLEELELVDLSVEAFEAAFPPLWKRTQARIDDSDFLPLILIVGPKRFDYLKAAIAFGIIVGGLTLEDGEFLLDVISEQMKKRLREFEKTSNNKFWPSLNS